MMHSDLQPINQRWTIRHDQTGIMITACPSIRHARAYAPVARGSHGQAQPHQNPDDPTAARRANPSIFLWCYTTPHLLPPSVPPWHTVCWDGPGCWVDLMLAP